MSTATPITWARATAVRAARTAAQAALGVLGAGVVNVVAVDWETVASISAGAAVVSVLTSIVSAPPEVGTTPEA